MIKFILNKPFIISLICGFVFLLSCKKKTNSLNLNSFREVENPCEEGGESRFYQDASSHLWLSWVEYLDDTTSALMVTERVNKKWTPAVEIAQGDDWFVNWADFPAICGWGNSSNSLVAHWLQKSDAGTYNYDIMLKTSKDGGKNWGEAFKLNEDTAFFTVNK